MASTRQRPQMCMVVMYMNEIIMFRFLYFNVRYRLTIFRVVILTWADKLSESNSSCLKTSVRQSHGVRLEMLSYLKITYLKF